MFRQILVIFALISCSLAYGAGGVYKWVDENGAIQYRDIPPPQGSDYRTLKKSSQSNYDPSLTMQQLREKVQALDENRKADQKGDQMAQQEKNCELAKKNIDVLSTSKNPVRVDDDGNRTALSVADRQTAVEEQQRYLEQHCAP